MIEMEANPTQAHFQRTRQTGFSLIELMVALVLGLVVSAGIITLFSSTSKANRVQAQLARMQEQGRFAVSRFIDDLRMGNAQYCSNSGGIPTNAGTSVAPIVFQDQLRSPQIFVKALDLPMNTVTLSAATEPYPMPASYFMRGYECDNSGCTPTAPVVADGIPAQGIAAGDRVKNSDILTVRALRGTGWSLDAGGSSQTPAVTGTSGAIDLTGITLAPAASSNEPPASHFQAGDLAMLAECSNSQVFAVSKSGNVLTPDPSLNFNSPGIQQPKLASRASTDDARVYDFSRDFVTVTYFLELRADDNPDAPTGHLVGVLMRKINGQPAQELIRGVERLDFRYGIADSTGRVAFLTADEVDDRAGNSMTCPKGAKNLPTAWLDGQGQLPGCMWRAVKTIEVSTLLDSVDYSNLTDGELAYTYPPDGSSVQTPGTTPTNGLERSMMRRSFTALVSVRNGNF